MVIYSSAIKPGNIAYEAAYKQGIPLVRRAEALAAVMLHKKGVVVAGTHGKTTTSALTAHVLRQGGMKPSHYVGAEIPILGSNAHWDSEGELFVAEGDESDGTLVNFHPEHSIILNIEPEHLDFYADIEAIKVVFRQLLSQTKGLWIYCAEDPVASELCANYEHAVSYGWDRALHDFSARIIDSRPSRTEFEVFANGLSLGNAILGIPGKHNVSNALAAIALASRVGVSFEAIQRALGSFRGAKRRFDSRHASSRFTIIDDYGHHPAEMRATLEAVRGAFPGRRLVLAFQPHRYTRTRDLFEDFVKVLCSVDALVLAEVYAAGEPPIVAADGRALMHALRVAGQSEVVFVEDIQQMPQAIMQMARDGDVVITMGAGSIGSTPNRLLGTSDADATGKMPAVRAQQ